MRQLIKAGYYLPLSITAAEFSAVPALFFYYPSEEYISYLMTVEELEFYDEIHCGDLFSGIDSRERIVIFLLS